MRTEHVLQPTAQAGLAANKLIRNTYSLLSLTLLFSALTAGVSLALNMPVGAYWISIIAAFLLIWFALPRTANSAAGLGVVFAITGLLGFSLGPILSLYLSLPNGPQIVATALGGTGAIFIGLSAYAFITRRDFSFMGGFLFTGMLVIVLAAIANIFLAIPLLSLVLSGAIILLMSGFILFDTSRMIHHAEHTNYVLMTVGLYLSIFNIFINLLQILGIAGGDD